MTTRHTKNVTQPQHDELKECCGTCRFCMQDGDDSYCFVDPPFETDDGNFGRGKMTRHDAPPCRYFILKLKLMS